MALEKAVKEDEKRAQKREKLLKEMKNATGEMKTTSPTNEAAKTKDESKSSLQAVQDARGPKVHTTCFEADNELGE